MPLFPCAFAVERGPTNFALCACCVEAMNRDEAFGKARRIADELWPGRRVEIKVNGNSAPLEPGQCSLLPVVGLN